MEVTETDPVARPVLELARADRRGARPALPRPEGGDPPLGVICALTSFTYRDVLEG